MADTLTNTQADDVVTLYGYDGAGWYTGVSRVEEKGYQLSEQDRTRRLTTVPVSNPKEMGNRMKFDMKAQTWSEQPFDSATNANPDKEKQALNERVASLEAGLSALLTNQLGG